MNKIDEILYFGECSTYPKRLAHKLGIANASILWYLLQTTKGDFFGNPFGFKSDISSITDLVKLGYILETENPTGAYRVNIEKILSLVSVTPSIINKTKPTFENDEFIHLCSKWQFKLKQKNRPKSLKEIYSCFEGKTLEESLNALRLSVNNNFVTLMFDEHKTNDKNSRNRGGAWDSGGSKNSEKGRNFSNLATKA